VVAYGITRSKPKLGPHYADPKKKTHYVNVDWQEMLPLDDVIPVQILDRELPEIPWATGGIRSSGFTIKPEYQERLSDIWVHYSGEGEGREPGEVDAKDFFEGGVRTITVNRYERDPRARNACLSHYGSTCFVCDVDLVKIYGKTLGQAAIHVHHVKPMATRGSKPYIIDPIKDLIPLCPNCHNVIHKTAPIMTPKALKKQLQTLGRK
jgi:5-methylcytosine-specific restriction protein A